MPFIEARYRTLPYKVLVGHSFGGLFAVHALLSRSEVFNAYIAISPSLWWDQQRLVTRAEAFFDKNPDHKGFLYFTMGNEGGMMLDGARNLETVLKEKASKQFEWMFEWMEEETHGSIPHRSTYNGLETLFKGWTMPLARSVNFLPADLQKLARKEGPAALIGAVERHYEQLSERLRVTITASEQIINVLGYLLLSEQAYEDAIQVFRRNTTRHPGSANAFDSLGDAYKAADQIEKAVQSNEKAVRLAEAISHPNLSVYKANLENVRK